MSTPSKSLRALLYQKIVSDLRSSNSKTTNHKLNRSFQADLFNLVTSDRSSRKALWAVRITRELWRRQIWTDTKAVEIMKEAALAEDTKVAMGAVGFFLGGDKEREELADESSDSEGGLDIRQVRHQAGINKKTKKNARDVKNAMSTIKRKERKKKQPHQLNFSAFHLLHDPQSFAETLFSRHLQAAKSKQNLEQKLMVLQLVSRLVGLHKLTIISLYSYFIKFLTPKQPSVTSFLASLAQSTHNLVPPDVLEPLIQKIANEFVSEASAGPVAAAGLNAIREICFRQPLAMNDTLLQDLVMYRKSKDKGVMMAAKGLLSLYRDVGPDMLKKRDRGKDATLDLRMNQRRQPRFGEEDVGTIEGLELLEAYKAEERRKRRLEKGLPEDGPDDELENDDEAEDAGWKNWDVEDDDSDSSTGWIDVSSEGEDIEVSDSDDDAQKRAAKKPKTTEETDDIPAEDATAAAADAMSKLASTTILTPADLAKLRELRTSTAAAALLPSARKSQRRKAEQTTMAASARHAEDAVTAEDLEEASRLGVKKTKEERIAMAHGEDDREKHKGREAKRKERKREQGKSTTNAEKARQKNFLMTLGKARSKNKRSLRDVGRSLKGHVERSKRGGRRGNN